MTTQLELIASQVMTALRRGQVLTRPLQRNVFAFAKSLMDCGDAVLARTLLRVLNKMEPYEAKFQWLLGLCEFHLGNWTQARRSLETHWIQTRRPQTAFMLARLFLVLGDYERMAECLKLVPSYDRYLVGNSPLFSLMFTGIPALAHAEPKDDELAKHHFSTVWAHSAKGGLPEFGPFFNDAEADAASELLGRIFWRRGLTRLDAAQADMAISDFKVSEDFLKTRPQRGAHV